jgi:hypothetical protein
MDDSRETLPQGYIWLSARAMRNKPASLLA